LSVDLYNENSIDCVHCAVFSTGGTKQSNKPLSNDQKIALNHIKACQ